MASRVKPRPPYVPPPKVDAKKAHGLSRRKRSRMTLDDIYNAMSDIYLECNPECAVCGGKANQTHHICRGDAGRAATLLNSDTWLPLCGECHEMVDGMKVARQIRHKQQYVAKRIWALKT